MVLSGVKFCVLGRGVVKDLKFAHTDVCGIAVAGVTDCQTVVAAWGQFEFQPYNKVGVFFFCVDGAAFAGFADDSAVADFIVVKRTSPSCEVFAVEDWCEAFIGAAEHFVGFVWWDFADEDVAPSDFAAVGLELDRTFWGDWEFAVEVIFHNCVVNDQFIVEVNSGAAAELDDAEVIPFTKRFIGEDERVFAWGARGVIPESAGAFVCADAEFCFFCVIPNLDLWAAFEVDSAIGFWDCFVINQQFKVSEILVCGKV